MSEVDSSCYELQVEEAKKENSRFLETLQFPKLEISIAKKRKRALSTVNNLSKVCTRSSVWKDQKTDEDEKGGTSPKSKSVVFYNSFGDVGVPVGTVFASRLECCRAGVHRPPVAGIHGKETEGCYSLALSGGYEDDLDEGDQFTYTGSGGRNLRGTKGKPKNLRVGPQVKNQTLTGANLALSLNVQNKQPVRVVRGFKLNSPYAPSEGYRYDGLYAVTHYTSKIGKSGFIVYQFTLKRCENQAPAPWVMNKTENS